MPTRIDSEVWLQHFAQLKSEGLGWFDFLTAIDRGDHVDVVARVTDQSQSRSALVTTAVSVEVASLTSLYAGAAWYERETLEMFGIGFAGLTDQRPLLHRFFPDPPPLRKSVPS
ncbi:MAG: NADH-quinone oxidoreductase subunit C [Actinomycetota bacterium]|nr:NADH-quinone oxidoreductase subunit C [Actinomycetota bacterium]